MCLILKSYFYQLYYAKGFEKEAWFRGNFGVSFGFYCIAWLV